MKFAVAKYAYFETKFAHACSWVALRSNSCVRIAIQMKIQNLIWWVWEMRKGFYFYQFKLNSSTQWQAQQFYLIFLFVLYVCYSSVKYKVFCWIPSKLLNQPQRKMGYSPVKLPEVILLRSWYFDTHRGRVKSVIRPALYLQATRAGFKSILVASKNMRLCL